MSNQPFEFRPSGIIEFEQLEPVAVAQKLQAAPDNGLDNDLFSITFGRSKGEKPSAAERMLAGATIDWLVALPVEYRPKALCERFPHVANRLAREWLDAAGSKQSLQALADDARWGSAGFPLQVQGELRRMLERPIQG
jgi:hypothetical protein